ncbi:MAG: hypothetical protein ABSH32_28695 [Bryobacteraceae bacterium]|jgi:hypothetical protein
MDATEDVDYILGQALDHVGYRLTGGTGWGRRFRLPTDTSQMDATEDVDNILG